MREMRKPQCLFAANAVFDLSLSNWRENHKGWNYRSTGSLFVRVRTSRAFYFAGRAYVSTHVLADLFPARTEPGPALSRCPRVEHGHCRAVVGGRPECAVDAGRQPDQMASGAYDMVLREDDPVARAGL